MRETDKGRLKKRTESKDVVREETEKFDVLPIYPLQKVEEKLGDDVSLFLTEWDILNRQWKSQRGKDRKIHEKEP